MPVLTMPMASPTTNHATSAPIERAVAPLAREVRSLPTTSAASGARQRPDVPLLGPRKPLLDERHPKTHRVQSVVAWATPDASSPIARSLSCLD
jgi:hypothetical protein